jgi:hypothetical protein
VRLSKTKVQELWDNGLNVMDIAMNVFASVGDPDLRAAYDREYERGIDRDTKKKLLQSYCTDQPFPEYSISWNRFSYFSHLHRTQS